METEDCSDLSSCLFIFLFILLTSEVHFITNCAFFIASFFCYLSGFYGYRKKGINVEFECMLTGRIFGFQYVFRDIWPESITTSFPRKTEEINICFVRVLPSLHGSIPYHTSSLLRHTVIIPVRKRYYGIKWGGVGNIQDRPSLYDRHFTLGCSSKITFTTQ